MSDAEQTRNKNTELTRKGLKKEEKNANILNMKYAVTIRKTKYGYDTHVPSLPGCHSQGKTEREALLNTKDAILTYMGMV